MSIFKIQNDAVLKPTWIIMTHVECIDAMTAPPSDVATAPSSSSSSSSSSSLVVKQMDDYILLKVLLFVAL